MCPCGKKRQMVCCINNSIASRLKGGHPSILFNTGEAKPGGLGPVLGSQKDLDTLETVQQRNTERRLEHLMNKDMMRELELFSLEMRRFTGEFH